ncbi:uncharacterized protein VTP21DRAFT_906 [Calcarisporiella thermophila]|uniref:uncharacterized protein n=1 Tax=Calcarisporiella thermophila TaxID=911321 RepID=UPI0037440B76
MATNNLIEIASNEQFNKTLDESKSGLVVLDFWASWAPACLQMNEVVGELAAQHPTVTFLKIEAENLVDISEKFDVAAVPYFVLLKNGKTVEKINGANAPELTAAISKHSKAVPATAPASVAQTPEKPATTPRDLTARLKTLVNAAPVMVFIKGTPSQPRCGFSRELVQILGDLDVRYSSFNILADEEVRQGLKTFSNWPTFPQVYVNGEFIGGLDIVKEMLENGELQSVLPKEEPLESRLSKLVNKAQTVVFIKGTPATPRCGFSRQIVSILNEKNITYDYFDILSDEEIRQGLKTFVNWPTYPMLFHKGELLGGLDIVKEMVENGEFEEVLKA